MKSTIWWHLSQKGTKCPLWSFLSRRPSRAWAVSMASSGILPKARLHCSCSLQRPHAGMKIPRGFKKLLICQAWLLFSQDMNQLYCNEQRTIGVTEMQAVSANLSRVKGYTNTFNRLMICFAIEKATGVFKNWTIHSKAKTISSS